MLLLCSFVRQTEAALITRRVICVTLEQIVTVLADGGKPNLCYSINSLGLSNGVFHSLPEHIPVSSSSLWTQTQISSHATVEPTTA